MNFIVAYFKGIWHVVRSVKLIAFHYLALLLVALLSALPLFNLMKSKVGDSLAIERLLPGFDYTVYQDFMNAPGVRDTWATIMNMNQWLLLLFLLVSVFLTGGVLKAYKYPDEKFNLQTFFSGCTYYFWRLLRMTVYFLIVHAAVAGLFVFIWQNRVEGGFEVMETEVGYIDLLKVLVPVYLLVASWFFMVHDYAKIHLVHRDEGFIFKSFWQSFPLVFGNFFNTFFLYLLNALTFVGVVALFYYLNKMVIADNPVGIASAFLLGQGLVLGRIAVRLLNLASATLVYKGIMKKRRQKIELVEEQEAARLKAIADAEEAAILAKKQAEDAEYKAAIATRKARLAEQAAAAVAVSTTIDTDQENTEATTEKPTDKEPDLTIPPTAQDALKVVYPPPVSKNDFEEEE